MREDAEGSRTGYRASVGTTSSRGGALAFPRSYTVVVDEALFLRAEAAFQNGHAIGYFWPTWQRELRAAIIAALAAAEPLGAARAPKNVTRIRRKE